jgi:hypothetical protein
VPSLEAYSCCPTRDVEIGAVIMTHGTGTVVKGGNCRISMKDILMKKFGREGGFCLATQRNVCLAGRRPVTHHLTAALLSQRHKAPYTPTKPYVAPPFTN